MSFGSVISTSVKFLHLVFFPPKVKERANDYFELNKVCYYLVTLTLNRLSIKYIKDILKVKTCVY